MSKKQKNETSAKAPVKLTRAEKKEIQAVIRKYKGDGKPHSAQASIPYEAMYQDGVCRVTPRTFSKCIEFTDISYQLAQADTKTAIFENLCDLYNYLDASIHVQFSFINRKIDPKQYAKSFEIRAQGDDFDDIRSEYSDILQDQLVNGNNGLMKRKFMTYTIEADSLKMARARLRRIETDLLGYFKSMGPPRGDWTPSSGWKSCTAFSTRTGSRFLLTGSGLPRRGFPPRTLSPRPRSASAMPGCSGWAANTGR